MAIKKIIPSPLSKKFGKESSMNGNMMQYMEEVDSNGTKSYKSVGEYNRSRLPGSNQGERTISYSTSKKRFMISGFETNNEELNELVKKCNLFNDIKKHPDYGRQIVSCDVYNLQDPFFNNLKLILRLDEGYGVLNTDHPIENLLYLGALVNSRFQIGGETINPALNARAKYIIVDTEVDKLAKKKIRESRKTAEELIRNMSDDKKKAIAFIMGLTKSDDTSIDTITELLEDIALDTKLNSDLGMSKQKFLIKLAESSTDDLETRRYIDKAMGSLIKLDRETRAYMLFGNPIGKEKQNVIDYLMNPVNSDVFLRLKAAVNLNNSNDKSTETAFGD
jgi:hypothetical protein